MAIFQVVLLIFGVVFFALGYRKLNRNWMLLGTVLLVFGLVAPEAIQGFRDGFAEGYNEARHR
ncbi:hypothetical protein [Arenimonas alkanexedens]